MISANVKEAPKGQEMSEPTIADDKVSIGYHAVLFIDVLNQRELLQRWSHLPTDDASRAQFIDGLKKTAGTVNGVRKLVDDFFTSYLNGPSIPVERMNAQQRQQYETLRECSITTQVFSDTVIAYSPVLNESGAIGMRGVYALMSAAASTIMTSLACGVALRGSVDVGLALELRKQDLYGPVLHSVYRLEQAVAQYPRIVVGGGIIDYLRTVANAPSHEIPDQINRETAKTCTDLIAVDSDGVPFVDHLGETFRKITSGATSKDLVEKGLSFAVGQHKRFCESGDFKLAGRYACLRQYYEARDGEWKDSGKRT